jgi:glycosyl transferase family 21
MDQGASLATGDWLLFTDADVIFRPDAVRRAVAYAEHVRADHLVVLPTMVMKSVGERMMTAFFVLGLVAVRPWRVPDPDSRAYAGAGAFNMIRRRAYHDIGGMQALRLDVIEDVELGRRVKRAGLASRVALGLDLLRIRWARGAFGMVRNMTKNAFALVGFRWWVALPLMLLGLAFHVAPFALVWIAPGWSKIGFAIDLAALLAIYLGFRRFTRISPAYFLLHPVAASLMTYAMLRSMVSTVRHGGVVWRGTRYPMADLRRWTAEKS